MAPRPLFPSQQPQYAQVSLLKPAPFCNLFAGLGSTNKSATSPLSSYLTLALSSFPSFFLLKSPWQELSSLSSCSNRLQWVPGHLFLPKNDAVDELDRRRALLAPSAIPCSLSLIHSCFFSDWRRTVSSKFFDTQVSSISIEELVLSRCVFSSTLQRTQPSVKLFIFQHWQNQESFLQRLRTLVLGPLSSHSAPLSYGLCAACSLETLCLPTISGPGLGKLPGFCGSMVFRHAPIPRQWSGNNNRPQ